MTDDKALSVIILKLLFFEHIMRIKLKEQLIRIQTWSINPVTPWTTAWRFQWLSQKINVTFKNNIPQLKFCMPSVCSLKKLLKTLHSSLLVLYGPVLSNLNPFAMFKSNTIIVNITMGCISFNVVLLTRIFQ